jgi:hypothetical protein
VLNVGCTVTTEARSISRPLSVRQSGSRSGLALLHGKQQSSGYPSGIRRAPSHNTHRTFSADDRRGAQEFVRRRELLTRYSSRTPHRAISSRGS